MATRTTLLSLALLGLCACSAHHPLNVRPRTDLLPDPELVIVAHDRPVYVTRAALPPTLSVDVLGVVDVGSVWYGGEDVALQALADGGRALGADAVVAVELWHQPSGFAWHAPHGRGTAVRLRQREASEALPGPGAWR